MSATVSNAYVSRNGQTAYFSDVGLVERQHAPTLRRVGTTVTSGGSGYTAPTAAIVGGIALQLTFGGHGYTSAPTVTLTGGDGSGASAAATVSGGAVSGFTVTPVPGIPFLRR